MKVSIIVVDDDGNTFEGEAELSPRRRSSATPVKKKVTTEKAARQCA